MIVLRRCSKCKIEKPFSEFHKDYSSGKLYYKGKCKSCQAIYDKIRHKIYHKKYSDRSKLYRLEHLEILRKKAREMYYLKYRKLKPYFKNCEFCNNPIKPCWYNTRWCDNCKKRGKSEYQKKYVDLNRISIYKSHSILHKKYMKNNPLYVLRRRCRSRLWDFITNKSKSTPEYIGCSLLELKRFLQNQFKKGMNWENIGDWHIDHKIPLCSAKTEQEILKLCHYSNLQPLWKSENCKKAALDKKFA